MPPEKKRTRRTREQIESDKKLAALEQEVKTLQEEEVYDHVKIRKESRDRVPTAFDVLDKVMNFDAFENRVKEFFLARIAKILSDHNVERHVVREVEMLAAVLIPPTKDAPTIAQMMKAAELIFDRAGDKPATAAPADDGVIHDYLEMGGNSMPRMPN